jgi:hypothetical protein
VPASGLLAPGLGTETDWRDGLRRGWGHQPRAAGPRLLGNPPVWQAGVEDWTEQRAWMDSTASSGRLVGPPLGGQQ